METMALHFGDSLAVYKPMHSILQLSERKNVGEIEDIMGMRVNLLPHSK